MVKTIDPAVGLVYVSCPMLPGIASLVPLPQIFEEGTSLMCGSEIPVRRCMHTKLSVMALSVVAAVASTEVMMGGGSNTVKSVAPICAYAPALLVPVW